MPCECCPKGRQITASLPLQENQNEKRTPLLNQSWEDFPPEAQDESYWKPHPQPQLLDPHLLPRAKGCPGTSHCALGFGPQYLNTSFPSVPGLANPSLALAYRAQQHPSIALGPARLDSPFLHQGLWIHCPPLLFCPLQLHPHTHTHTVKIHSETLPLLLTVPLLRPLQASHSLSFWAFFFSNLSLGSPFRELSNFVYFPPGLPFLQSERPPPPPALTSLIPPCLPTAVQPLPDYS